jgi:hypothetical protein
MNNYNADVQDGSLMDIEMPPPNVREMPPPNVRFIPQSTWTEPIGIDITQFHQTGAGLRKSSSLYVPDSDRMAEMPALA